MEEKLLNPLGILNDYMRSDILDNYLRLLAAEHSNLSENRPVELDNIFQTVSDLIVKLYSESVKAEIPDKIMRLVEQIAYWSDTSRHELRPAVVSNNDMKSKYVWLASTSGDERPRFDNFLRKEWPQLEKSEIGLQVTIRFCHDAVKNKLYPLDIIRRQETLPESLSKVVTGRLTRKENHFDKKQLRFESEGHESFWLDRSFIKQFNMKTGSNYKIRLVLSQKSNNKEYYFRPISLV